MDPTVDHVRSTIQFGVKLVVYFCVHKHHGQRRAIKWSLPRKPKISELTRITTTVGSAYRKDAEFSL